MRNSSPEGVLRFMFGLGKGEIGTVGTKGIEFKIAEPGDWLGARVVLKVNKKTRVSYVDLIPQVGARKSPNEEWAWYLEKDVNPGFDAMYPKGSEFRIVGGANDHLRLLQRLKSVCPTYQHGGMIAPPMGKDGKVGLNYLHEFTAVVRRCLAKIAFNYLAFVAGDEFARKPDFDPVRSFVRYGVEPHEGIVLLSRNPILADELVAGRQVTDGHILTVEVLTDRRRIQARLALFNSFQYRIILASNYGGIWFAKGHHFDVRSKECTELAQTRLVHAVAFR